MLPRPTRFSPRSARAGRRPARPAGEASPGPRARGARGAVAHGAEAVERRHAEGRREVAVGAPPVPPRRGRAPSRPLGCGRGQRGAPRPRCARTVSVDGTRQHEPGPDIHRRSARSTASTLSASARVGSRRSITADARSATTLERVRLRPARRSPIRARLVAQRAEGHDLARQFVDGARPLPGRPRRARQRPRRRGGTRPRPCGTSSPRRSAGLAQAPSTARLRRPSSSMAWRDEWLPVSSSDVSSMVTRRARARSSSSAACTASMPMARPPSCRRPRGRGAARHPRGSASAPAAHGHTVSKWPGSAPAPARIRTRPAGDRQRHRGAGA